MGEGKDLQVQLGLGLSLLPEKERSSASCLILSPWWVLLQQVSLHVCAGHNLQLLLVVPVSAVGGWSYSWQSLAAAAAAADCLLGVAVAGLSLLLSCCPESPAISSTSAFLLFIFSVSL